MRDHWRHISLPLPLLCTVRLDRRTLLRTAGSVAITGTFGVTARGFDTAAQETNGAIIRSRPRAAVMEEVLATYPLRSQGVSEGGSVIVGSLGDFDSFNPLIASSSVASELLSLVYEGLIGLHPVDGSIVPGLADYELAADGVTYTFSIHPDARFHDGTLVTAADVEFTLDTLFDPTFPSPFASSFNAVLKAYRATSDRTVEMVSNGPIASFLYDAPLLVMPKHIWQNVAPADWRFDVGSTGLDPARVIGSGPFRFVEIVMGDRVVLERNDDYWDRELNRVPYLDKLIFRTMPDSDTRYRALEAGDIDVARLSPAEFAELANTGAIEFDFSDSFSFTFYAYQLDPEKTLLFQEAAVRQALFLALDRQAIIDSFLDGNSTVARGTLPPLSPAYRPNEFDAYAYDPDRARALLAQAGWTDTDDDHVLEKDGQRFSFSMLVRGDSDIRTRTAAYMQDAWAAIGVEMEIEQFASEVVFDRIDTRNFDMVLLGMSWSVDPAQGWMFETGAYDNFFSYSNTEYDQLEAEQRRTLDHGRRIDLIVEQAKIVWDELPVGILSFDKQSVGHSKQLNNIFSNAFGFIWSAPFWHWEG